MTEEKVAPHFYVPRPRVEENSTKTGALQRGDTPPTAKVLKAAVYQKQAIVDSLKRLRCGMRGGQPASHSGKEYRLVRKLRER